MSIMRKLDLVVERLARLNEIGRRTSALGRVKFHPRQSPEPLEQVRDSCIVCIDMVDPLSLPKDPSSSRNLRYRVTPGFAEYERRQWIRAREALNILRDSNFTVFAKPQQGAWHLASKPPTLSGFGFDMEQSSDQPLPEGVLRDAKHVIFLGESTTGCVLTRKAGLLQAKHGSRLLLASACVQTDRVPSFRQFALNYCSGGRLGPAQSPIKDHIEFLHEMIRAQSLFLRRLGISIQPGWELDS